jgi:hypothetical protein
MEFKELLHVETEVNHERHDSVPGQVFAKILDHANKQHANLLHLFHRFDADDSGGLEPDEFRQALLELGITLSAEDLDLVMEEMDRDGDGYVSTKEFSDRMRLAKKDIRAKIRDEQERERATLRAEQKAKRLAARSHSQQPHPPELPPTGPEERVHGQAQASAMPEPERKREPVPEPEPEPEPETETEPGCEESSLHPAQHMAPAQPRGPVGIRENDSAGATTVAVALSPALSPVLSSEQFSRRPSPAAFRDSIADRGPAFAELRCAAEGWIYQMTQPSIVLGRKGKSGATADVLLTGSKAISRKHAVISAVNVSGSLPELELSCVGKNHVTINQKLYAADSTGIRLRTGDTIKIGGVELEVVVLHPML